MTQHFKTFDEGALPGPVDKPVFLHERADNAKPREYLSACCRRYLFLAFGKVPVASILAAEKGLLVAAYAAAVSLIPASRGYMDFLQ